MSTLEEPCSINVLTLSPLSGQAYLVFDRALAFALVDIFFGGNGVGSSAPPSRVFTDTELRMMRRLRHRAANALVEAWGETLPAVSWQLVGEEFNPQFIGNQFATETTIVTTFEVALNETRGLIHLGISYPMLEPLRTSLLSAIRNPNAAEERDRSDRWREAIERAPLGIRCPFVELELTVREILALKVGDVIPVELPESVDLEVEGIPVLRGPFGVYRGKRAVRVENLSQKDQCPAANEFITGEQSNNG
jgi:flagellar motor switch protein FliM